MCHSAVVAGNSLGSVCSGVLFEVILAGRNEEVDTNHPLVIECQVRPAPPPRIMSLSPDPSASFQIGQVPGPGSMLGGREGGQTCQQHELGWAVCPH